MSGWIYRVMINKASKFIILISLFHFPVLAEEIDLELLEFLGEWETDEGQWVDPEQFAENEYEEKEDEKTTE